MLAEIGFENIEVSAPFDTFGGAGGEKNARAFGDIYGLPEREAASALLQNEMFFLIASEYVTHREELGTKYIYVFATATSPMVRLLKSNMQV